jgi:hypothetical protein
LLQCLVLFLIRVDGEHARSCFRLCAELTARAEFAIGRIAFDMDDVFSMPIMGGDPVTAGLALWARHLMGLPVNAELSLVEAALITGPALWYRQLPDR